MFSLAVKKCVLAFSNWLPLQQFVSVHISKAQYIRSDCHKLGVVPVLKGLHGNWDTVHLGGESGEPEGRHPHSPCLGALLL